MLGDRQHRDRGGLSATRSRWWPRRSPPATVEALSRTREVNRVSDLGGLVCAILVIAAMAMFLLLTGPEVEERGHDDIEVVGE